MKGVYNHLKNRKTDDLIATKNKLEAELLTNGVSDTRISTLDNIDAELERRDREGYRG